VNSYIEACTLAGATPIALEIEPSAIARAVIREGSPSTHLILDFGKSRTGIGIVHSGMLMFTSTVDIGGQQLDASLKLTFQNADATELIKMKNEKGLLLIEGDTVTRDALLKPITVLKTEIQTRISYWNSRPDATPIESVILCGGIANLAGLPEFFSEELGIKTEQASVWKNIFVDEDTVPPITKRYSYGYATALGLALASFKEDYE
jgi:type IV pilus assembly protein PilM